LHINLSWANEYTRRKIDETCWTYALFTDVLFPFLTTSKAIYTRETHDDPARAVESKKGVVVLCCCWFPRFPAAAVSLSALGGHILWATYGRYATRNHEKRCAPPGYSCTLQRHLRPAGTFWSARMRGTSGRGGPISFQQNPPSALRSCLIRHILVIYNALHPSECSRVIRRSTFVVQLSRT
jgi:hypothetical protein